VWIGAKAVAMTLKHWGTALDEPQDLESAQTGTQFVLSSLYRCDSVDLALQTMGLCAPLRRSLPGLPRIVPW